MNKNIKLAVAGAVLALSASANAGIIIPAGDWTVDIGGNVNSFYTRTKHSGAAAPTGNRDETPTTIQTGLLPSSLGIGGKTRQNDVDVAFQFSFWMGSNATGADGLRGGNSNGNGGLGYGSLNIRQSYLSFGDKSWGSILVGRNLGIFGSDAILSDMTLLGVGSNGGVTGSSTLGRIGSGYIYADWKAQMAYTTPNFNGLEGTVALTEGSGQIDNGNMGYEAKASYSFAGDSLNGKLWVGGKSLKIQTSAVAGTTTTAGTGDISDFNVRGGEIGAKVDSGGFGAVAYYYAGKNMDANGGYAINTLDTASANFQNRDNYGGYAQLTYVLPTKTKLGVSYGLSVIEAGALAGSTAASLRDGEREASIVGLYHPLTKHLNLVTEYNHLETQSASAAAGVYRGKSKTLSLGAILFF